ncbi:unnamed protein product [Allacma fusca]|uniref:Uncharacterized protein n=1 Tax=Allacma fusca TaxID=39272 RepID=A0A8J2JT29_9HEXA|nr:unnamed protein product [Allacma fusca]
MLEFTADLKIWIPSQETTISFLWDFGNENPIKALINRSKEFGKKLNYHKKRTLYQLNVPIRVVGTAGVISFLYFLGVENPKSLNPRSV